MRQMEIKSLKYILITQGIAPCPHSNYKHTSHLHRILSSEKPSIIRLDVVPIKGIKFKFISNKGVCAISYYLILAHTISCS